ncbi:tetratricopeptide repeat protein [Saccharothrix sp. BKS2]|uniref:ATP-binding protein n=1 Tax=Saccharothrix sp. BKS2 TaxID=3064400 RepID=UPI0039EB9849
MVVGSVVQAGSIGGDVHVHPAVREQPPPRQLPPVPARFVGRAAELERLTSLLDAAEAGGAAPVLALSGAGGIGKTWLVVRWAYRHLDRFPDGQLFVDLRGFSPDSDPMEMGVAVRGFLDALGVEPGRIPTDLHAQAALYRSLVAGRRMLIVLDNAATAEQAAPLLPGGRSCVVVTTSRRTPNTLVSRHGAHHLRLDPLAVDESHELLTGWLGADRVAAEPDAVAELVGFCRGFALALGLIAGHAHTHPGAPLARLAGELREFGLDVLDDDDPAASLPKVLSWSYRALSAEQQRVFGLVGIAPGPDLALPAAADLTGLPPVRAKRALRGLEEASLLDQDARGRYAMHDLVRSWAVAVAHEDLPDEERDAALRRVLDSYAHVACAADRLLAPHRLPVRLDPPVPGVRPEPPADAAAAMAWLEVEHPNLLAAQNVAVAGGRHRVGWLLAWALDSFHGRRGHLRDRVTTWRVAVGAAAHLPEHVLGVRASRFLGRALAHLGSHEEAVRHLHRALSSAEEHRDNSELAQTHRMLAWAWGQQDEDRLAVDHAARALELFRALDQPVWEADALNQFGRHAARLGELEDGLAHCRAALELYRGHHNPDGEAATSVSLGYIEHRTGRHERAAGHYEHALALYRALGNTYMSADVLRDLGGSYAALGRGEEARGVWSEALELYRRQGREEEVAVVRGYLGS